VAVIILTAVTIFITAAGRSQVGGGGKSQDAEQDGDSFHFEENKTHLILLP
jgi:hypothetical protein